VPALRTSALCGRVPDGRFVQTCGRHCAGRQTYLYRLPLLRDGLPYGARSFIHETVTGQKPDVPRGKGTVESCTLCVHRMIATGTLLRRCLQQGWWQSHGVWRPQRWRRRVTSAPSPGAFDPVAADLALTPACAIRGFSPERLMATIHYSELDGRSAGFLRCSHCWQSWLRAASAARGTWSTMAIT